MRSGRHAAVWLAMLREAHQWQGHETWFQGLGVWHHVVAMPLPLAVLAGASFGLRRASDVKAEPKDPNPYDICECGDYREQHEGPENRGRCKLNGIGHGVAPHCGKWRFFSRGHSPYDYRQEMGRRPK